MQAYTSNIACYDGKLIAGARVSSRDIPSPRTLIYHHSALAHSFYPLNPYQLLTYSASPTHGHLDMPLHQAIRALVDRAKSGEVIKDITLTSGTMRPQPCHTIRLFTYAPVEV